MKERRQGLAYADVAAGVAAADWMLTVRMLTGL